MPEVKQAFDGVNASQQTLEAARQNAADVAAAHPLAGITDPAHVPDRYMVRGDQGAQGVKDFVAHSGGDPAAMQAFDERFVGKMHEVPGLVDQNTGLINARKLDKLTTDYSGMLSERPELARKLSDLKSAQDYYDTVKGDDAKAARDYQNGVVKHFLGGVDPVAAVQKVFNGPNAEKNFAVLVDKLQDNPEALNGMRAAVSRYLVNQARDAGLQSASGLNPLKTADLSAWIEHNKPTLMKVFGDGATGGGQAINNIYAAMKEMRLQGEVKDTAGLVPTASKSMFKGQKSTTATDHGVSGAGMLAGGVLGHVLKIPLEVAVAIGGVFKNALHGVQQAGLKSQDDLVATMLASPETTAAWRAIRLSGNHVTPLQINRFVRALTRTVPIAAGATTPNQPTPQRLP
jgi:hypothetical protein